MPRPPKWRRVDYVPEVTHFKPAGIPLHSLEEVIISIEEAEAIRLKDLEELDQEECAQKMKISRPTFHRVLGSARKKLADAILSGKAIRIEGGNYEMAMRRFKCRREGHEWDVPFDNMIKGHPLSCPKCKSQSIQPAPGFGTGMRGRGRCRRGSDHGDEHE